MAISDEITRLQQAKADLKTAIENKGVIVPSSTKLDGYADLVDSIEQGGGGEWTYIKCDTLVDCTNPNAKIGIEFYIQYTNSSNLIVEFISTINYTTHAWGSNKLVSQEPTLSKDFETWYRIKPNNMNVGDVGTLTITQSTGTVVYTFKLIKTFSETTELDVSATDYSADIEKLNVSGGSAPYIVNPLNGGLFGDSANAGGIYSHQYEISEGSIVDAYFAVMCFNNMLLPWVLETQSSPYHYRELSFYRVSAVLQITETGLMTLTLGKADGTNPWLPSTAYYLVILVSDTGSIFVDRFGVYNNYTCFIKDTNIILANKTNKKIQDITYDDELLVWNFDDGKYDSAKPLWIKKTETTNWYYKLTFSDGTILKVTGAYPEAHSLYSVDDGKFVHANNLVGKKVYTLNGIRTLDSCEEIHEDVEFYNIITDYHMNLFANNVLTSTSLNNLYPIRDMMFIKDDRKPAFDVSMFDSKWVNGLRLDKQQKNVIEYVNNLIRLQQ